jgi:metallophosphoesterase (TIGR00282 family)
VAVANLSGRIFMPPMDCPFRGAEQILEALPATARVVLLDFHAEATSEKRALACHLDGKVTAVVGTHTHVATADAQVLPGGTGYITDVGMTGVAGSVIGLEAGRSVQRFRTGIPRRHVAAEGEATVCGVLIHANLETGRCRRIERVERGPAGQ